MNPEKIIDFFMSVIVPLLITLLIVGGILGMVDMTYLAPIADNAANTHCQRLGFDQYKSYSRIGLLSTEPVGIKCEYAERYTDLGVRTR